MPGATNLFTSTKLKACGTKSHEKSVAVGIPVVKSESCNMKH